MTTTPDRLLALLQQLEQQLLHTDFRNDPRQLEYLLAEGFQEVSPIGQITTRAQVISWLLQKNPTHRWQFSQWQLHELAPSVCLLHYHAVQCVPSSQSKGALHSSLWCHDEATQQWRLRFHQSSKVT